MSLFKPLWGKRSSLDSKEKIEGNVYFCKDDGTVHVDYLDDNGDMQRFQINAKDTETLANMTLDEIQKSISWNDLWDKPFGSEGEIVKTIDEIYIPDTIARTTYVDAALETKADKTELDNYYLKTEADTLHTEVLEYVDTEVAALVNSAPETLDTLGELATAFEENQDVVEALDAAITTKQDKISNTLILVDAITGTQYKIQIQNGQLVSFPVTEE